MTEQDEREALAQSYCPVHGDLLAGTRSTRCSEAPKGHEFLHRQGQITEAMVQAAAITIFTSTDSEWAAEDWHSDWLTEETRNVWRKYARAALEAAEEARRG